MSKNYQAHETAVIDEPCSIGAGSRIWHFAHVCADAVIGENCVLGQNTMVSSGVSIGSNVKIQNNVAVYSGVTVEDDVFLGPSCVLTNVSNPRSEVVRRGIYEMTLIRRGATVGANATIIPGVTIGRYAFIAAGAVVSRDVPDYANMRGVPARQAGWSCPSRLPPCRRPSKHCSHRKRAVVAQALSAHQTPVPAALSSAALRRRRAGPCHYCR